MKILDQTPPSPKKNLQSTVTVATLPPLFASDDQSDTQSYVIKDADHEYLDFRSCVLIFRKLNCQKDVVENLKTLAIFCAKNANLKSQVQVFWAQQIEFFLLNLLVPLEKVYGFTLFLRT